METAVISAKAEIQTANERQNLGFLRRNRDKTQALVHNSTALRRDRSELDDATALT